MADMGADVIKVERPGSGDDSRAWGAPFIKDGEGNDTSDSSYFLSANRGKKSVTIDIGTSQGQEIVRKLAMQSDVLIENYKVGTLARYGLDYASLRALNPKLVYCSITGYGQDGPCSSLPGYDYVFQGIGGLMSITGLAQDDPLSIPTKSGLAIVDFLAGMYATTAILAAIEHRNLSGTGDYIDIALLDCIVGISSYQALNYFLSGKVPVRMGNAHSSLVPYQVFKCDDGDIIIAMANESQFGDFCKAIGMPELAVDARYSKASERNINRVDLIQTISAVLITRSVEDWTVALQAENVPVGPILNIAQTFDHPQVRHRGMKKELPHGAGGNVPNISNPMRFSGAPIQYREASPLLGEHTSEVLRDRLDLSDEDIARLKSEAII